MDRIADTRHQRGSRPLDLRATRPAGALLVLVVGLVGCGSSGGTPKTAELNPTVVKAGTLTVCTSFPYRPFEFRRDGEPTGFDIDLVNEVASELKLTPLILNVPFDDVQSGQLLNEGKCDVAIAGITITGERARVLDFSSPYFDATQAMVVKRGSGVTSLDDLSGQKIGVQAGTTGELYVTDNAPKDAEIVTFPDASGVDGALRQGDVAAGVYDNSVVGGVVARNSGFEVAAEFDTGEQYGMAVKKNGSTDLLRFINNVLAKLKANGGYDQIYARWFG